MPLRNALVPLMTALLLAISAPADAGPLKPAKNWLSVWNALQNQSNTR
jgi:hypothetical protein